MVSSPVICPLFPVIRNTTFIKLTAMSCTNVSQQFNPVHMHLVLIRCHIQFIGLSHCFTGYIKIHPFDEITICRYFNRLAVFFSNGLSISIFLQRTTPTVAISKSNTILLSLFSSLLPCFPFLCHFLFHKKFPPVTILN